MSIYQTGMPVTGFFGLARTENTDHILEGKETVQKNLIQPMG
jgi:hypothetical protein